MTNLLAYIRKMLNEPDQNVIYLILNSKFISENVGGVAKVTLHVNFHT